MRSPQREPVGDVTLDLTPLSREDEREFRRILSRVWDGEQVSVSDISEPEAEWFGRKLKELWPR